jgi:nucleoside-diphosphate-sugar epimerase
MKCVVTGAGGFIGSHLCEGLLAAGHEVTGVDAFIPYYPAVVKKANLAAARVHSNFRFCQLDLRSDALEPLVAGADVIFHLAGMPGLVRSWSDFDGYWTCNVQATQRLMEAIRHAAPDLRRMLYASTSSVYGRFGSGDESLPVKPISPYGVTKLAGENLCRAYGEEHGLPVVVLRYFSVFGPRQRPDMGYFKFVKALLRDEPIVVYGDGQQVRGNTYVSDCVAATMAAVQSVPGEVYNVGGGEAAGVWDILRKLEALAGHRARVRQESARPGDQRYTLADTNKLRRHCGWEPRISLDEGLRRQWEWQHAQFADIAVPDLASTCRPLTPGSLSEVS